MSAKWRTGSDDPATDHVRVHRGRGDACVLACRPRSAAPPRGTIRGRVDVKVPLAPEAARPDPGALGMCVAARRRWTVAAAWSTWKPAPRAAFDAREEPHARMDQRNETFVPHVLAIVAGHDGRLSQRRRDVPQRVLAVEDQVVRSRPLCRRPVQGGAVRPPRHRSRLLRHPLAHERVHPRLRAPLLRGHRRRGPLPDRRRAAGHLHA